MHARTDAVSRTRSRTCIHARQTHAPGFSPTSVALDTIWIILPGFLDAAREGGLFSRSRGKQSGSGRSYIARSGRRRTSGRPHRSDRRFDSAIVVRSRNSRAGEYKIALARKTRRYAREIGARERAVTTSSHRVTRRRERLANDLNGDSMVAGETGGRECIE